MLKPYFRAEEKNIEKTLKDVFKVIEMLIYSFKLEMYVLCYRM